MDTVSMLNKMSFYCQPILPLVYDESMSYYETLCKVVGQLNTTGETVNKLNEGLTSEINNRHEAERLLNERLKVVEEKTNKIHFLIFAGTPPYSAQPVGTMPTRSELRQWINDRDMIITLLETTDEESNIVYAMSCNYNAVNWAQESPAGFNIIVPISTDYDSERDHAIRQKIAKITIPSDPESSLDERWGLQVIEINTPSTSADGVVNIVAVISNSDSVNCSITPAEFFGLYNMARGGKNLCVAVNAKLEYDSLTRSSSVATVDIINRKIRIAFERDYGTFINNGVKQLNKTLDYIIGDVNTNIWTHETIDSKTLDFPRYVGFQFTRGAHNVITTDDESTPNAVYTQYHANESGKLYQNLPTRLIDTVDNTEYWNGTFDIKDGNHMTFTFVASNYAAASDKMLVHVIELSADVNTTAWKYAEKEFELPITGSFTVDDALSDTSANPVQNKVITGALAGKASTAVASRTANGLMSSSDYIKLLGIEDGATNTVVDADLNANSTNPVQNKTVTAALNSKLPKTGGTVTGALRTNDSFSAGGTIAFGEAPIGLSQTDDGAAEIRYGNADVNDNPPPLSRLKVARPTADDDAATKAYVDGKAVAPILTSPVMIRKEGATDSAGVYLSTVGVGEKSAEIRLEDVNENAPVAISNLRTPTGAGSDNYAATKGYVDSKVAGGGSPDAVLYTAQTLTDAQKKQARDNIDAAIADFVIHATTINGTNYTLDKTFAQIQEAVQAGKKVYAELNSRLTIRMPLVVYNTNTLFFGVAISSTDNSEIYALVVTASEAKFVGKSALTYNSDGDMPQVYMSSDPDEDMQIATKKYVDDHLSGAPITIKLGTGNAATSTATFAEIKAALEAGKAPILDSAPGTSHWFALNWTLSGADRLTIQYGTFNVDGGGLANCTFYNVAVSSTGITYASSQFTTE